MDQDSSISEPPLEAQNKSRPLFLDGLFSTQRFIQKLEELFFGRFGKRDELVGKKGPEGLVDEGRQCNGGSSRLQKARGIDGYHGLTLPFGFLG